MCIRDGFNTYLAAALDEMPSDTKFTDALRHWSPGDTTPLERLLQRTRGMIRHRNPPDRSQQSLDASQGAPIEWPSQDIETPEEAASRKQQSRMILAASISAPQDQQDLLKSVLEGRQEHDVLPPELLETIRNSLSAVGKR